MLEYILILGCCILNFICIFALCGKINSLNENLYRVFKCNGMLDDFKWNEENFYMDLDEKYD